MKKIKDEKFLEILQEFKRRNPWQGKIAERKRKFLDVFAVLCEEAGLDVDGWHLEFDIPDRFSQWHDSGASQTYHDEKVIILRGRLSVITLLHEFGHIYLPRETSHVDVQRFAVEWFAKVFPEKMANLKVNNVTGLLEKRPSPLDALSEPHRDGVV
jgi:hypothetical protein